MSYEINIIAIDQKEPVKLNFNSSIMLQNEKDDYMVHRYSEIWPYFSNVSGILYSLVVEINEDYYSAFPICDSDFETDIQEYFFSACMIDEGLDNITPFIVTEPYVHDFIRILHYVLTSSPQKRILFQTRYQGGEREIIIGVIKIKSFLKMLVDKKIFFNVCYIIEND